MKRYARLLILFLCACNPNKTVLNVDFHPTDRGWGSHQPVWADEFNSTSLDSSKWVAAEFCGGYNGEQQCYRPQNISISGGHMTLTAQVEGCDGDGPSAAANEVGTVNCPASDGNKADFTYTSARIHTRVNPLNPLNGWRYGRVEVRARLPYGQGTWPAFWMMPVADTYESWPRSGEMDIMETVNLHYPHNIDDFLQSNTHQCHNVILNRDPFASPEAVANCSALNDVGGSYYKIHLPGTLEFMKIPGWAPDLVNDFHTYAVEWSDGDIRYFVDNRMIGRFIPVGDGQNRFPFRHEFYLIINLAVGGDWPTNNGTVPVNTAGWLQNPVRAELVIDWVRVYTCVPDPVARNCIYRGEGLGERP